MDPEFFDNFWDGGFADGDVKVVFYCLSGFFVCGFLVVFSPFGYFGVIYSCFVLDEFCDELCEFL